MKATGLSFIKHGILLATAGFLCFATSCSNNGSSVAGGPTVAAADGQAAAAAGQAKKIAIISAGQSNIDGRNGLPDFPAEFPNPNPAIHFCNNIEGRFADLKILNGGYDKDWAFDSIVYNLLTSPDYGGQDEIYVMKRSMGGTSIDALGATEFHWTSDFATISDPEHSLLLDFRSIVEAGVRNAGDDFEIKAFVWHQGEGDAQDEAVSLRYYDNLRNMVAYVRAFVGNPELPFFTGSFSHLSGQYSPIVEAAQKRLAAEDPNFHLVDMSGSKLKDAYHFTAAWSRYLGEMIYNQMVDAGVIAGRKVTVRQPE